MNPAKYPPAHATRHDLWLMQAPVISTSHFAQADIDSLYDPEVSLMQDNDGRSILLCIDDPEDHSDLSEAGRAVLNHFHELRYNYLRLDPDGMIVEGLPVFEEGAVAPNLNDPASNPADIALTPEQ